MKNDRRPVAVLLSLALILTAALAAPFSAAAAGTDEGVTGRPPAVPLITHDPYFSVWSMSDRLTDEWARHWTGRAQPISVIVRIDGRPFRAAGPSPSSVPALEQTGLRITPTRSIYTFSGPGVELVLTFLSPLLIRDLDIMSRPVSYITADVRSTDGAGHEVRVYFGFGAELAVNTSDQNVFWGRDRVPGLEVMSIGSQEQSRLAKKGDDLRIDWGWLYAAAPQGSAAQSQLGPGWEARVAFSESGALPESDLTEKPAQASEGLMASFVFDYGQVTAETVGRHVLVAYDDVFSIEYFYRRLRPYWRRGGWDARDLLVAAEKDYGPLSARCVDFDRELIADLEKYGGPAYAFTGVLAYRQSIAAQKLAVDFDGSPCSSPRRTSATGASPRWTSSTRRPPVPSAEPRPGRAMLEPVKEYASSSHWTFPFAPHDLGTYPMANGQVYGGGEKTEEDQMPVEESGNMIILVAALAEVEGNAEYAERFWPLLSRWAGYLKEKGLDPENQLCTDDFAGHLAHNANLSLKAILALRSYGWLAGRTGRKAEAKEYNELAGRYARQWMKMADDGDHYRLAFDKPGTWSQKYNLVWDKILGFNLFPGSVAGKELAYYLKVQQKYGLPLDNRKSYTKLDWIYWTAAMAGDGATFEALIAPIRPFLNETQDRVPMTDWYWTDSGRKAGFQARSVVGGVFIKLLSEPEMRKKWAVR